jgi:homogentisate 1,2-dioxygenase
MNSMRVVVALNLGYVVETLRAEGQSPRFAASHDEFAMVLDGKVRVDLVKHADPDKLVAPDNQGAVRFPGEPVGKKMGHIKASRGHQVLLPKGAAYRFDAKQLGVILMQTILGDLSVRSGQSVGQGIAMLLERV